MGGVAVGNAVGAAVCVGVADGIATLVCAGDGVPLPHPPIAAASRVPTANHFGVSDSPLTALILRPWGRSDSKREESRADVAGLTAVGNPIEGDWSMMTIMAFCD